MLFLIICMVCDTYSFKMELKLEVISQGDVKASCLVW